MPVYQYACTECGHELEVRQSFSDDPLTVCPTCEGRLRKVLNAVGVVFKGSGFYRTDSRKESSAATKAATDSSSSSSSGSASEAGSSSPSTGAGKSTTKAAAAS